MEEKASVTSVKYLFLPPNKASAHSDRYKGILDAKAQPKQNTNRKDHIDAHFAAAVVKFVRDFVAAHPHTCIFLSVDDKAKVNKNGKPAVSWYFQIKKMYIENSGSDTIHR